MVRASSSGSDASKARSFSASVAMRPPCLHSGASGESSQRQCPPLAAWPADAKAQAALLPDLSHHLVQIQQRPIDDALARAHLDRRHLLAGAVAALAHRFDRGEVLVIVVAVAEEQKMFEAGAFLRAEGGAREGLTADA